MIIPVFIINRNRLTTTRNLYNYLLAVQDCLPIIIDCQSTYRPLIDWYASRLDSVTPNVKLLSTNLGHLAAFRAELNGKRLLDHDTHEQTYGTDLYAVTDSDLDLTRVPLDLLQRLESGLRSCHAKNHKVAKAGLSLKIDDLPDGYPEKQTVLNWEKQYWKNRSPQTPLEFFDAAVDTTFALYTCRQSLGYNESIYPAIRAAPPYTAVHVPWYLTPTNLDSEERYYLEHCDKDSTHWTRHLIDRNFLSTVK